MVSWGFKGPLVFFDSNDTSKLTDWIYEVIGLEDDTLAAAKESLNKEANLLGDGRPSTCKHRCISKAECKHVCCKPGHRDSKLVGNMTMP